MHSFTAVLFAQHRMSGSKYSGIAVAAAYRKALRTNEPELSAPVEQPPVVDQRAEDLLASLRRELGGRVASGPAAAGRNMTSNPVSAVKVAKISGERDGRAREQQHSASTAVVAAAQRGRDDAHKKTFLSKAERKRMKKQRVVVVPTALKPSCTVALGCETPPVKKKRGGTDASAIDASHKLRKMS